MMGRPGQRGIVGDRGERGLPGTRGQSANVFPGQRGDVGLQGAPGDPGRVGLEGKDFYLMRIKPAYWCFFIIFSFSY